MPCSMPVRAAFTARPKPSDSPNECDCKARATKQPLCTPQLAAAVQWSPASRQLASAGAVRFKSLVVSPEGLPILSSQ